MAKRSKPVRRTNKPKKDFFPSSSKAKKKVVKKAVKKALDSSVIIKRHEFTGIDRKRPFGTSLNGLIVGQTFDVFYPLQMAKSTSNSNADDFNNRESNRINARNCLFRCNVQVPPTYTEPFQIKIMAGYFKGDDNIGTGQLTPAGLKALYPEIHDLPYTKNAGQRDFYWKYTRTYTMCPKQLYDGAFSLDIQGDDDGQANRALWLPKEIRYNFKMNRLYDYESQDGDSLQGWMPLIAIQAMPLEGGTGWTRPDIVTDWETSGAQPGPLLHTSMITYFNDCH